MRKQLMTAAVAAALLGGGTAQAETIRVQSTTDTVDAGLAADFTKGGAEGPLILQYEAANPGDDVKYVGVGTGAALQNARDGAADVVITHAPSLERTFFDDGQTLGPGRQIFYSDYVIVGPKAGKGAGVVPAGDRNDAVKAYEDIAAAGAAGGATFVSRNDNSGTNVAEQLIWKLTGDQVVKSPSTNTATSGNTQSVPQKSDWYPFPTTTGTDTGKDKIGQAANIARTDECPSSFPNGGCFTMTDRGSFNRYLNNNEGSNLEIVAERNAPTARGGENLLINPFSAYVVNPSVSTGNAFQVAAAQRFVDFITSPGFQSFLPTFPSAVDPAFRPNAYPSVSIDGGLPQTAAAGQEITVAGTAANPLPGGRAIVGLPVTLQRSTDNGTTWTDAGNATTVADGRYALRTTVSQTAQYRFSLPQYAATDYSDFTANVQPAGTVTVPAATGTATPTPTATPPKLPTADTTKPRVSRIKVSRRKLSLRVSEAATVKVTLQRIIKKRVKGKRRTTYRTVKKVTLKATRARTVSKRFKAIKRGRYRISVTVTDAAGNRRSGKQKLSVKR